MEPESKVLGSTFDALGSESHASNESKVAPGLKIRTPAPIQVPLNLIRQNETNDSTASKVPALRPTLESVDAFQPDAGPNRMTLMHRNSWPWGADFRSIRFVRFGPRVRNQCS